jgi:hypothetical protein
VALPGATANAVGKVAILLRTAWTGGTTSSPVDDDLGILGRSQGHMEYGALFGDVDLLATKHGVDAWAQTGFLASPTSSLSVRR